MKTYRVTFRLRAAGSMAIDIHPPVGADPEEYATRLGEHGERTKYILVDIQGAAHLVTIADVVTVTIQDVT